MKRLIVALLIVVAFAVPASAEWLSSGRITNPIADQVIADTGALPGICRQFTAIASASVATIFELQLRNAANTATLKSQILAVPASGSITTSDQPNNAAFCMADNERLRIVTVVGVTGSVSASLFYTP